MPPADKLFFICSPKCQISVQYGAAARLKRARTGAIIVGNDDIIVLRRQAMQTFKVLSAFYIKDKDALLVAVEGRDARFKPGARIRDAFGRTFTITALTAITAG